MEDEDSECQVTDNWSVLDDLQYRNSTIEDTISHFNNISTYSDGIDEREDQCHTICPPDSINKNSDLNSKFVFKGFKKRILAQTQENQNTLHKSALQEQHSTLKNPKDKKDLKSGKVNEYAQYLGLQPLPISDQPTPNSALQPAPNLNSQPGNNSNSQNSNLQKPICLKCHSSGNYLSKKQPCSCSSTMVPAQGVAGTSDMQSSQLSNKFKKIQRKVYLCAACGTYFENWNLFLHMRDVHQRHLCLFCLGLFDRAERLSYHLMKNHSIPETSFTSVEEFYQTFKGSCYLICCSCEKVFTETDNFYNHFCSSPQKVQTTSNVCSICRQVDGTHMTTCGLAPGSDSEVSLTPGSPEETVTYKNKLPVKGTSKKLMRLNRIANAGETLVNHFQAKGTDLETKKANVKVQKQSLNREIRKEVSNSTPTETEAPTNPARDTVAETIMEVSRYTGESDNNEQEEETRVPEEKPTEREVTSPQILEKQYDSYTETIMEVSRVGVSEKTSISEADEEDPAKNTSLNESTNTVSDGCKEDEIKSSNPKNEDDVRLSASSPLGHHSDTSQVKNQDCETQNERPIDSASNSPVSSPANQSVFSPQPEFQAIDSQSKIEEEPSKTLEPVQRISDYQSFNTVTKTDRSLVIKICTNKNSQFSIAPRVIANSSLNTESEENNNRESSTSEEKNSERGRDSPESFHLNECDSDSDSEKLAVADSNAEDQDQHEGDQELNMETEETNGQEKEEKAETEAPESIESKPEENDGIILAGEEIPFIELNIEDIPENMEAQNLLRKCVEAASFFCVYCYHARQIAINGKQLGLHMLSEHRFQPLHPAVILQSEQVISKVKKSIDELDSQYFNLDTYNTEKGTYHIPIPRTFECFHCRFYSPLHKDIYLHNRKMHQKTILICIMCKSTFYSYSELLCHLCPGIYSSNENVKYRCCLCPVSNLPSAFRLMVHLRKRHHACDVCLESTGNQQRLSNHVWKHKLHHLCYRCGIAYRNKPDITKHLFWKHGTESVLCKKCLQKKWPHVYHFCIPPTAFVCEECSLSFSKAVALKVHKRLHTGEAPYACEECSERFISKKLLAKHEETHKEPVVIEEPAPVKEEVKEVEKPEKENEETQKKISEGEMIEVVKDVKEPVKKVDVYDLPPLNLSSDSDSDSDDEKPKSEEKESEENKTEEKKVTEIEENSEEKSEIPEEKSEPKNDEILIQESVTQIDNIVEVELNEEEKKEEAQIMDGIWDNFKSYAASLGIQDSTTTPAKGTDTDIEFLKSVVLADHDYCTVTMENETSPKEGNAGEHGYQKARSKTPEIPKSPENTGIKTGYEQEANKKKLKASKKRKRNGSSSSSDSSSDSDSSSCSCGSNCSCSSSSGSSSSSSSSSDSDSSASEGSPKKKKKDKGKNKSDSVELEMKETTTQENGTVEEIIEPGDPPQPVMRESDLETDESETDEDFYDEHPQQLANKLLAEKRNQLQLLAAVAPPSVEPPPLNNGNVLDTDSPGIQETNSPSVQIKKKVKTKKRKKADKGKQKTLVVESIKLNIPKSFYENKPGFHSSPSVITVQPSRSSTPNFLAQEPFDSTPNIAGSGSETENKRSSKRKRIPKRFYGDSSDEENEKQIPKWRKMDTVFPSIPKPQVQPQIQRLASPPFSGTTLTLKRTSTNYRVEEPVASPSESDEPAESSSVSESEADEGPQIHLPQHLPPNPERVDNLYCYCQCPYDEVSEMIACDGSDCRIEWFHFECVGIMVPPKGKWYCPDCRKRLGILENYEDFVNSQ